MNDDRSSQGTEGVVNTRQAFGANASVRVISASPNWISLLIAPTLESKEQVCAHFREQLKGLQAGLCDALILATDELLTNAIEHGSRSNPQGCVEVSLIRTSQVIMLHVRDDGEGFPVDETLHAAINNPPGDPLRHFWLRSEMGMRPGGFGIMLVKQIADELVYNERGNEVLLIKLLAKAHECDWPANHS